MNALRWFFFLTLSILMIASCTNAAAEFDAARLEPARVEVESIDSGAFGQE